MAAAKFTRATQRVCDHCACAFTPIAYRPDRNKFHHNPRQRFCSERCKQALLEKSWAKSVASVQSRFWPKVQKAGPDQCWIWLGAKSTAGYGSFGGYRSLATIGAHRQAFLLANGPIPDGLHVRHKCDNPPCCNPKHLELGTHQDNMSDKAKRGRQVISEAQRMAISAARKGKRLSLEHRAKMSAAKQGKPALNRKAVVIDGVVYASISQAKKERRQDHYTIVRLANGG